MFEVVISSDDLADLVGSSVFISSSDGYESTHLFALDILSANATQSRP